MSMYRVEVDFTGKVSFEVEADDKDDAASKATEIFEDCDKGRLVMGDFQVTGTYAERMSAQDIKELKCDV